MKLAVIILVKCEDKIAGMLSKHRLKGLFEENEGRQ